MPEINNFNLMNLYVYNYKIKNTNKYLNILIPHWCMQAIQYINILKSAPRCSVLQNQKTLLVHSVCLTLVESSAVKFNWRKEIYSTTLNDNTRNWDSTYEILPIKTSFCVATKH